MKSPLISRVASRPITLANTHHPPKFNQVAPSNTHKFSTTPQRLFLDECLMQTHSLITGIHDITGLPWTASTPLATLLIRVTIRLPTETYCRKNSLQKSANSALSFQESKPFIEKKIKREQHRHKSPLEIEKMQQMALADACSGASGHRLGPNCITLVRVPDMVCDDGDDSVDDGSGGRDVKLGC